MDGKRKKYCTCSWDACQRDFTFSPFQRVGGGVGGGAVSRRPHFGFSPRGNFLSSWAALSVCPRRFPPVCPLPAARCPPPSSAPAAPCSISGRLSFSAELVPTGLAWLGSSVTRVGIVFPAGSRKPPARVRWEGLDFSFCLRFSYCSL